MCLPRHSGPIFPLDLGFFLAGVAEQRLLSFLQLQPSRHQPEFTNFVNLSWGLGTDTETTSIMLVLGHLQQLPCLKSNPTRPQKL